MKYDGTPPEAPPEPPGNGEVFAFEPGSSEDRTSRFWRSVWRLHFYSGVFAMPMLVLLSVTGLIILYTDPIYRATDGTKRTVEAGDTRVALDDQLVAAQAEVPDLDLAGITTPRRDTDVTIFNFATDGTPTIDVYVDPYTGTVTGTGKNDYGTGIVGLANRLHAHLNNDRLTVKLPNLDGVFNAPNPIMVEVAIFDLVIEIMALWGLVLAISGIYLWWPRKRETGKALFVPRIGKRGRARWRDLHAVPGILLSTVLIFFVATGIVWSQFWGANWYSLNQRISADRGAYDPPSTPVEVGELDVFGNRIPWVSRGDSIPRSSTDDETHHESEAPSADASADRPSGDGEVAERMALEEIATLAEKDGLLAGFTIALPVDGEDENGEPFFGSFAVTDPWPARTTTERVVYFDQFSGVKLGQVTPKEWGRLAQLTEWGVQSHMGTQLGVFSRVIMTFGCIAILWASFTAFVMWWKRRPAGRLGLPRRPVNVRLARGLFVIAVALGILFPAWGLCAVLVVGLDRFAIRKILPLRRAFGMR
jgi:uncharacterized iron-regulated membrane protein